MGTCLSEETKYHQLSAFEPLDNKHAIKSERTGNFLNFSNPIIITHIILVIILII